MTYEELQMEHADLNIRELDLSGVPDLKGIYIDGNIAVHQNMNDVEKSCVLAEELGHHYTTTGNILNLEDAKNRKQEKRARFWAYNKQIGLYGLIRAFERGCRERCEVADFLNVTEEFLLEAIDCYHGKYGICEEVDNYVIFFEPCLAVMKKIN